MKTAGLVLGFLLITQLCTAQTFKTESGFQKYFEAKVDSLDQLEGLWNVSTSQLYYRFDTLYDEIKFPKAAKVAIMKRDDHFDSYNLTGESYNVEFTITDVSGVYLYKNYFKETGSYSKAKATISTNGRMDFSYEFPEDYLRFKLGDSFESGTRVVNRVVWSRVFPEPGPPENTRQ